MSSRKLQLTGASFFDKYAHEYDRLTNARARYEPHKREIASLIRDYAPSFVVDAGCATGLSSLIFASEGITTVGFDREPKMIATAKKQYGEKEYPLKFVRGSFEDPPKSVIGKADLLVCLANGISGLGTVRLLRKGLKGFHACLRPGGKLVIQMLNFGAITENRIMPIRATRDDGIIYVRYARRVGRRYSLHINRIDNSGVEPTFEPFCHEFDNFSPAELMSAAKLAGFKKLKKFADINRTKKFTSTSRDLVMVGEKAAK